MEGQLIKVCFFHLNTVVNVELTKLDVTTQSKLKRYHDFLRDNKKVNRLHNMHIYYKV